MFCIHDCEMTYSKVQPLLTVVSSILTTASLIERGYDAQFMSLILPCFSLQYLPPLIANGTVKRFTINVKCVWLNMLGLVLGMFLHNQRVFLRLIGDFPVASKVFTFIGLVNSHEDTIDLITWLVVKELTGILIRKQLMAKSFRIRGVEAVNSFLCIAVLYLVRTYDLSEKYVIMAVFMVPVVKILFNFTSNVIKMVKRKKTTEAKETPKKKGKKAKTE